MILLDPSAHPVIGHRGAAASAPENTLESFRLAVDLGAEALEFDVRRSADGEAVVCHDPTVDRTTDLRGPVASFTAAELARADAGFHFRADGDGNFPFRGRSIGVPTVREVLTRGPHVPLLIEIKEVEAAEPLARVLLETGAAERAVVAGTDWRALIPFRSAPLLAGASRRDIALLYLGCGGGGRWCRCYAVPDRWHGLEVPTARVLRHANARGATMHVWTVDDAAAARRLWSRGVNGIVTNRPDRIRRAREQAGG